MCAAARESADRCAFSAPVRTFRACPLYHLVVVQIQDTHHKPLRDVVSCLHLKVGRHGERGGFYARCGLGGLPALTPSAASAAGTVDE